MSQIPSYRPSDLKTRGNKKMSPFYPTSKKLKKKRGSKLKWLIGGVVLYGVYLYIGSHSGLIQQWRLQQKRDQLKKEIITLSHQQDSLQQVIHLLQHDTNFIEKVAREKYFMGRPGETIYSVILQPNTDSSEK